MAIEDIMKRAAGHHMNPAMGRARAKMKGLMSATGEKPEGHPGHEHGKVTETSVVKHRDGTAHVRAKHEDGHEEIHNHPHEAAAHEHAKALMEGGGAAGPHEEQSPGMGELAGSENEGPEQEGAVAEEGQQPDERHEGEDQEGESCPECGAEMKGDECPQCGYKRGGDEEEESGEGY